MFSGKDSLDGSVCSLGDLECFASLFKGWWKTSHRFHQNNHMREKRPVLKRKALR